MEIVRSRLVVDFDLELTIIVCERYALLPNDKKQMIAGELDRSVREIERKVSVCAASLSPFPIRGTV